MNGELTSKKNSLFNVSQIVIIILLSLGALNVLNKSHFFFIGAFIVFLFTESNPIKLDATFWSLVVLSACFCIFSPNDGEITLILKPFTYPLCYLIGKNLLLPRPNQDRKSGEKKLFYVMLSLSIALLIHIILNFATNGATEDRNTIDFWTGEILSATLQAGLGVIIVGFFAGVIFSKNKIWLKLFGFLCIVVVLAYNLILAGRTLLLIFAIIIIFAIILIMFREKNSKFTVKVIAIFLGVVLLVVIFYLLDIFGLQTMIKESNFYDRFFNTNANGADSEDQRFSHKLDYILMLPYNLWGGRNIRDKVGFAHDIFLDTLDEASVIALIAVLIVITLAVIKFIKCLKNKKMSFVTKQIIGCLYLAFFIEFCVEPVLAGMQWMFVIFCIFDGMVNTLLANNSEQNNLSFYKEEIASENFKS